MWLFAGLAVYIDQADNYVRSQPCRVAPSALEVHFEN